MRRRAFPIFFLLPWTAPALPEDWPQFRGPTAQGHSSGTGLPLEWTTKESG